MLVDQVCHLSDEVGNIHKRCFSHFLSFVQREGERPHLSRQIVSHNIMCHDSLLPLTGNGHIQGLEPPMDRLRCALFGDCVQVCATF